MGRDETLEPADIFGGECHINLLATSPPSFPLFSTSLTPVNLRRNGDRTVVGYSPGYGEEAPPVIVVLFVILLLMT